MSLYRVDTNTLAQLNRALVGFDTFFEKQIANQLSTNYPPHNILKRGENSYEIQIAVTGFESDEITVKVDQNQLIIEGTSDETIEEANYLYRGLAQRNFSRVFPLAEHIEVGEVKIKNGVLKIELTRIIPESLKPRILEIKAE